MKKGGNLFYTLWAAAIILCAVLTAFSLIFASCSKPNGTDAPKQSAPVQTQQLPATDETGE